MNPTVLQTTSNFAHKVRNTNLPPNKAMMPLYEAVSNSIHAIEEARTAGLRGKGKIRINIIRTGDQTALEELANIDNFQIRSFEIIDNGIGINDANFEFFREAETDHKLEIGGKGVGRFVCLKAFKRMYVESIYQNGSSKRLRSFEFKASKNPFDNYDDNPSPGTKTTGTKVVLDDYKEDYRRYVPKPMWEVARGLVLHFQLYFIQHNAPEITVWNQNGDHVNLQTIFETEFLTEIQSQGFGLGAFKFNLYLTKSTTIQGHKIHFCAHHRSVKEESLYQLIPDLGKLYIREEGNSPFFYQAFVVGDAFDDFVDNERVGFRFPEDVEETDDLFEDVEDKLTLRNIRENATTTVEGLLASYLEKIREEKLDVYKPMIEEDLQHYKYLFERRKHEVKGLPIGLSKNKLDIELYKLEQEWMREVKEEGIELLEEAKDVTKLEEYKVRYEKFLSEFNALGQTELARYIVHRRSILELLKKMLQLTREGKFPEEDMIHNIFFPIRTTSDEIPPDKQNLWLLDERLTFHQFLASDKRFDTLKKKGVLEAAGTDRTDLLIYNDAIAFAVDDTEPFNSFTIVEFKRPERDDYDDDDPKDNPVDQVEEYIENILAGNVTRRDGRKLNVDPNTPFYVYIVCDLTKSLLKILRKHEFRQTSDGWGYFKTKKEYYSAYLEVVPYEKILKDAAQRNKILFTKLGI